MDWHILMLPLLGLTTSWRGVRIGGKMIGGVGGLGASSNPSVQAFDKAKAAGDREGMEKAARQLNEQRIERSRARSGSAAGGADTKGASLTAGARRLLKKVDDVEKDPSWNKYAGNMDTPDGFRAAFANGERLYNKILKPSREDAAATYRALQSRRERISNEMMKVLDQYETATAKTRKANERRRDREVAQSLKRRSADNPYGLTGDGRSGGEARQRIRDRKKTDQRLRDRADRMRAQMEGLDAMATRLREDFRLNI